jgi:DNA topoisomerase I
VADGVEIDQYPWMYEPAAFAEHAGLVYVSDADPGFTRKPWGRGFSYFDPDGERVADDALRARFDALVIPPAWTDVWICPDPKGHIQVTGRDDRDRKQYIYHPEWEKARNRAKYDRLLPFAEHLPVIREAAEAGLRKRSLGFTKVVSAVVYLLDETLIRIGNPVYAASNKSFGLTTLRDRHVAFDGQGCDFAFKGKSGKEHCVRLDDPRLARVVKACRDVPGYDLFQYYDEHGERCTVSSSEVNDFLRDVTGQPFSAKDFRTWGGTVHAAAVLKEIGRGESEKQIDKNLVAMVKQVAGRLGNTPAVCREYYIHPAVTDAYRAGDLDDRWKRYARRKLLPFTDPEENIVRHLLKDAGG